MNIDYNAVIEILENFLNNEKTEILGISVGEERQVKEAIKNLLTAYEKEKEKQSKEIEELKNTDLTTVYLNGFYDGEKKVKDKIKVKIEEMNNIISENEQIIFNGRYEHLHTLTEAKIVKGEMQSLLEKE